MEISDVNAFIFSNKGIIEVETPLHVSIIIHFKYIALVRGTRRKLASASENISTIQIRSNKAINRSMSA